MPLSLPLPLPLLFADATALLRIRMRIRRRHRSTNIKDDVSCLQLIRVKLRNESQLERGSFGFMILEVELSRVKAFPEPSCAHTTTHIKTHTNIRHTHTTNTHTRTWNCGVELLQRRTSEQAKFFCRWTSSMINLFL